MKPAKASLLRYGFGHTQRRSSVVSQFGQNDSCLAENEFTIDGPSRTYSFEDESSIIDGAVHEKSLRHIRFVRVHIDKLPRSQNRCCKQNGKFSLLGHWNS